LQRVGCIDQKLLVLLTGPTAGLVLIVAGILLFYAELIWGAKLLLGVTGLISALVGWAQLWRIPHTSLGLGLLAGGLIAFLVEARFETRFAAAVSGSALLGCGFWKLCPAAPIEPIAAFSLTAILGGITTWLLGVAKRGRRNKRLPQIR
jgi:membrane-bound ClpP family serine protease